MNEHHLDDQDGLARVDRILAIRNALEMLNPDERRVLELRFGVDDEHVFAPTPMTFEAIADELGMTADEARDIEMDALINLRAIYAEHNA